MNFKVVGIGEVLWDLFPGGRQLGGAPANFTYHACALGADARLISRVGHDDLGREALDRLTKLGLPTDCIEVDLALPTGTVKVEVTPEGQPQFQIQEQVAWDALSGESPSRLAVGAADAICFGTLAQRSETSRSTIISLVAAAPPQALRILDVNLRQDYFSSRLINESLAFANVLKLNETELPHLAGIFDLSGDERSQILQLAKRNLLRVVAYTRGGRGSLLFSEGRWSEHPGFPTKIADTVGAGDSFTATLALGVLAGWPLDEIHRRASEVAAYVCSQPGGMPELPERLRAPFLALRPHNPPVAL